jgi:hypothetical protein
MIDTIDTSEFKIASKVVSMGHLGIDTIDTRDRHTAGHGGRRAAVGMLSALSAVPSPPRHGVGPSP